MAPNQPTRLYALDGMYNLRDVGGYPTMDGRLTRWGRLLRSDSPHRLDPAAMPDLLAVGIQTVIDLRLASETERGPNPLAAVETVHYENLACTMTQKRPVGDRDLGQLYLEFIQEDAAHIGRVVTAVAEAEGPVLVHCSAGKDRTGVIIAMLLGAVGVTRQTIITDYAMTDFLVEPLRNRLRQGKPRAEAEAELFERMLKCEAPYIINVLEFIEREHGSIPNYLLNCGVTPETIERLKQILVA